MKLSARQGGMMVTVGLMLRIDAKPDKADEVEAMLTAAVERIQQEETTPVWLAVRLGLVRYHRRGMGGSTAVGAASSIDLDASDALGLLDSLGVPSAHILGYSYGGVVALEAALIAPSRIRSLILLEPVLLEVPG